MTTPDPVRRLLDRVEPPPPPDDLEARSLAAARTAMARTPARTVLWTRLWESRAARLAWAAAVAGLVLGHVVLSLPNRQAAARPGPPMLLAGTATDAELIEATQLLRLRSGRLPQLDTAIAPRPAAPTNRPARERENHDA
jgi:hypothetical protein